ncbi:hypothetical protein HPB52_008646 [Rhipicephalus sanguineus]|uniref:Uncharacterized protein n=1 Tax=Rhipicephalus sanguineus TaxID=34632 RepID=A0A9D4QKS4_RHISA|nr:hypothetical protein HPB52_008646 [Rhipicephalus sanguineus]
MTAASSLRPASTEGRALPRSCSVAATLAMPVAAISWDASTVSDSAVASENSQTGLFGAVSALDTLLTIKVLPRDRTPRVAGRITLSTGPQGALKTFWAGTMSNLRLASHGDMGRERCEGHWRTGPFGDVLADDSLLTIKAPLRVVHSAGVACRITMLRDIPLVGLVISLAGTGANLRLAAPGEMGHERERCEHLFGAVSFLVNAAVCPR